MPKNLKRGPSVRKKASPRMDQSTVVKPSSSTPEQIAQGDCLPSAIKARWRTYFIDYVKCENEELLGQVNFQSGRIMISDMVCGDEKKATLLHEFFHAYLYDIGSDYMFSTKQIEHLCQIFSSSVIELIRENPDLIKWIQNQKNVVPIKVDNSKEKEKRRRKIK
jgi:hypothetical protein